jgi:hypothetical protein
MSGVAPFGIVETTVKEQELRLRWDTGHPGVFRLCAGIDEEEFEILGQEGPFRDGLREVDLSAPPLSGLDGVLVEQGIQGKIEICHPMLDFAFVLDVRNQFRDDPTLVDANEIDVGGELDVWVSFLRPDETKENPGAGDCD